MIIQLSLLCVYFVIYSSHVVSKYTIHIHPKNKTIDDHKIKKKKKKAKQNQACHLKLSAGFSSGTGGSSFFQDIEKKERKKGHANRFQKLVLSSLGNIYLLWNAMMIQAVTSVRGMANAKYSQRVPFVEGVISPTFMPKIP